MTAKKVITRIKGGLGNQLFCYAAARRLALVNNAELVIDNVTGFARDHTYRRQYALNHFNIPCRKATPAERMEPFEWYRRGLSKFIAKQKSFHERHYVEQERIDFDARILDLKVHNTVYLDGLWQSEAYFKDQEAVIRQDLGIQAPQDTVNRQMADYIDSCNAIAVHVRWFNKSDKNNASHNVGEKYYQRAIKEIMERIADPHFFVFSDFPDEARQILSLPKGMITCVDHNCEVENAFADLWLMTKCKHFIIANSTFSWWGAWLCGSNSKCILSPKVTSLSGLQGWGFPGLIPNNWIVL